MNVMLSRHAKDVMDEREVAYAEVLTVVSRPEVTYHGDGRRHPKEYTIFQRGEIAVVGNVQRNGDVVVVTILWRTEHRWTSDQMKASRQTQ